MGWILARSPQPAARSPRTVPIAGIRTPAQARDNAGTLAACALTPAQLAEIDRLLER